MFRTGIVVVVLGGVAWYTGALDSLTGGLAGDGTVAAATPTVATCGRIMAEFVARNAANAEPFEQTIERQRQGDSIRAEDFARVARTGASLAANETALRDAGCTTEFMNANRAAITEIMDRADDRFGPAEDRLGAMAGPPPAPVPAPAPHRAPGSGNRTAHDRALAEARMEADMRAAQARHANQMAEIRRQQGN